jgi:hypothetical protein
MINDIKLSKNFNINEGRIRDHSKLDIICKYTLNPHTNLNEAIAAKFVIRKQQSYKISNQYWKWCADNGIPFVAIILGRKYAYVEIDLLHTSECGFARSTNDTIRKLFESCTLKPHSVMGVGGIYSSVCVLESDAIKVAKSLYSLAISENVCTTLENLNKKRLKRASGVI